MVAEYKRAELTKTVMPGGQVDVPLEQLHRPRVVVLRIAAQF
jgi:hypothetical protein